MQWFWNKKKMQRQLAQHEQQSSIEVLELKGKAHQSTTKAKRDIDKLNRLLKANGITLKIHIATNGEHHHA